MVKFTRMKLVIKPKGRLGLDLQELWNYRELFYFLAWRDIKVRYRQTAFGVLWAILQPLLTMVVFTVFFGRVAGIAPAGIPYPIFSYLGLLFWQLFSNSLTNASDSFVANAKLVQKVYFPRLVLPISSTLVSLVDFLAATVVFAGLLIYYRIVPTPLGILLLFPAIVITMLAASGLGLVFATMNVKFRDVKYALPFFTQLLMFLTPVIYPVTLIPEKFRFLLSLNPMTGVIETMRAAFLGLGQVSWLTLGISLGISLILVFIGYFYLYRSESEFADVI